MKKTPDYVKALEATNDALTSVVETLYQWGHIPRQWLDADMMLIKRAQKKIEKLKEND